MSNYNSPLRYPGGKAKLSAFLSKVIKQKFQSKEVIYVEPYAGGAGAALSLLFSGEVSKIIINDLDPAIYAFWRAAVFDTDRFIKKIRLTPISIDEWHRQRAIYKNKSSDLFSLGFATFYLNRSNRSGIIEGGPIGGLNQSGEWKISARFNKKDLIDRLVKIRQFRNRISVTKYDGIKLLELIQRKNKSGDYFVFLDPPYIQKGQLLYLNHYLKNDHERLSDFLNNSSLNWVMTYDNNPLVRKLYPHKKLCYFEIAHTAHRRKIGKEVLISPIKISGKVVLK